MQAQQQRQAMMHQQQQQQQNGMMGFPRGGNRRMTPQQLAAMQGNPQALQGYLPPHIRAALRQNQMLYQQVQDTQMAQQQAQLHRNQSQEDSAPALDRNNSLTPTSSMESCGTGLENPKELGEENNAEAIVDTSSISVLDAMSDGSSPASFPEFSCKSCDQAHVQLLDLLSKISVLEVENKQLRQDKLGAIKGEKVTIKPSAEVKWATIYEVYESGLTCWYEDQPHWLQRQDRRVVLAGKKRIYFPKEYLQELKLGKVPFIVFQEFKNLRRPDDFSQHVQNWPTPTSSNVSIKIISSHLSDSFEALLQTHSELKENADFRKIDEVETIGGVRVGKRLTNIDHLCFHFQDLFEEWLHSRAEDIRGEPELLLQFLRTGFKRNHEHARELLSQKKIGRDTIFYLFKPGTIIVSQTASRIRGLKQMKFLSASDSGWNLACQSWTFDGKYHRENCTLLLTEKALKHGHVDITSLPFYPLNYAQPEIDRKLRRRGKTSWKFRKPIYVTYSGLNMRGDFAYDQARFLIDPVTWQRSQQGATALKGDIRDHTIAEPDRLYEALMLQDDLLPAEFPYLVPENITGFNMQDKKWVDLQVDNISKVKWDKKLFDHLSIAEEKKRIIKALILNKIARDKETDVVHGKENGLVVLLHGGPGTGKTLTAESVADLAEKPLYRVICGDIGTDPRKVEEYLENVFFLGKIWDCVVLLDEADVFLEQRSLSDLARNALVSVLLRTLEDYDGILILTSNRVGTFDEAVKSRIQLALHYDSLNREQRKHI